MNLIVFLNLSYYINGCFLLQQWAFYFILPILWFFVLNRSQDDPFLLYAALYSGVGTNFVSRDMMRGHKYLLKLHDRELNSLFWRWQCQHQYYLIYILKNGEVILQVNNLRC